MTNFCDKGAKFVTAFVLKNGTLFFLYKMTDHYNIFIYFLLLKNCEHQIETKEVQIIRIGFSKFMEKIPKLKMVKIQIYS